MTKDCLRSLENISAARKSTAYHEAGHAVARWLEGLPVTAIHVSEGEGMVEGSGEMINAASLIRTILAGPIAELALSFTDLDEVRFLESAQDFFIPEEQEEIENFAIAICLSIDWRKIRSNDFARVRSILEEQPALMVCDELQPKVGSVEDALMEWLHRSAVGLLPYFSLIERIAQAAVCGYLTATKVQSIIAGWAGPQVNQ